MTLGDFSEQADAYVRSRPGYPDDLLDVLFEGAGVNAGAPVADIGAGTGLFTRLLSERDLLITAIEPNAAMRKQAAPLPGVEWIDATFEETTLADSSQQWVVAAQAFHWADPKVALPEIHRILRPGGSLTAIWNNRRNEESDILSWTQEAISRHVPEFDHHYRRADWPQVLLSSDVFTKVLYQSETHTVRMTQQRYLDLWRSHNRLNTVAGPERMERLLANLTFFLESQHTEMIDVPYACEAWTVR